MAQFRWGKWLGSAASHLQWILLGCALCLVGVDPVSGQVIETLVGAGPNGFGGDGVPPTQSGLNEPYGIVFDATGGLLIADSQNHRIRYIFNNEIHTLVGTGVAGWSDSATLAPNVPVHSPIDVVPRPDGSYIFSDAGNHRIRQIAPDGVVTTLVGDGTPAVAGDGLSGTQASVFRPIGLVLDATGNLFWAEENRIRVLTNSHIVQTIAGIGEAGYAGDGGSATAALFNNISDLAIRPAGGIYVADTGNHRIRLIDSAWETVTTYAGNGIPAETTPNIQAVSASLHTPIALTIDKWNLLLIANAGTGEIVRIRADGATARLHDTAVTTRTFMPAGLARDASSNTYFAQNGVSIIRYDGATGLESIFAGVGFRAYGGDGMPANLTFLASPSFMTIDSEGRLVFTDTGNHRVRRLEPSGTISTIVGNGLASGTSPDGASATQVPIISPMGLEYDATGNLFVAEHGGHVIRMVTPSLNPLVFRVVGSGSQGYVDSATDALLADLNSPAGLVVDPTGRILFADRLNQRIRRAIVGGTIETLVGNGTATYAGDGGNGASASLNNPAGLSLNSTGELLIADEFNNRIRILSATGMIYTVVGNGTAAYSGDGISAVSSSLNRPRHAVMDASGNIYIADTMNHRIRKVATDGTISTIAGTGAPGFNGDGGQAIYAQLDQPFGLLIDSTGDLLIADSGNSRIRIIDFQHLEPAIVNSPNRETINFPGSATLTVLDSGNGKVIPGRVRAGGLVRADLTFLDRSFATPPLIASVSWRNFAAQYIPNSLLTNGNVTAVTETPGTGILFDALADERSLVDVSFTFLVGDTTSTRYLNGSPLGTVLVVDATDPGADNRSIRSDHPGNLAWTGAADAGVVSTTIEIDNTPPGIETFHVMLSDDDGVTFHPITFPSVNGGDILLITATVRSDSLASLGQNIEDLFNSDQARFESVYSSTSLLQAGAAGDSLFAATVTARAVQNPLPSTPKKVQFTVSDDLGNETWQDAISIGVKTFGPSLITSDLIVNGKIAPEGTYRIGPDSGASSVAEVAPGDEIQLVATFGSFNSTGLERVTADFTPLYPPKLSPYVNALVPSVTRRSGSVLTATWTFATVDLGAGGISEVTFAHLDTIGKTPLTLSTAGLPPGVTPAALAGAPGTPRMFVQAAAIPQSATTIRVSFQDTDSAFPVTSMDTQTFTVDTQPPEARVSLVSDPPFRTTGGAIPGVSQRVKGGDRLSYSVEFTNPLIDRDGDDLFASGTSVEDITADLSAVAGPLATAVTPTALQSIPHPGLPTTHIAQFDVTVSDQLGTTETTSMQPVESAFYLYDDVGNALAVIEPATPIAIDNNPPLVNTSAVHVLLEAGLATDSSGNPIQPGQDVPTGSTLFPETALRITGTNIWDPIDSALDILTTSGAIRVFFNEKIEGAFAITDAVSSAQNVFPTFVLTMPSIDELRTTQGFSIILAASDMLGNSAEKQLPPTFSVNGDPSLTLDVLDANGEVVTANAAGKTVTILANRQTTILASSFDLDTITDIQFKVDPADRFALESRSSPSGGFNATRELQITPKAGTFLGPATVVLSATDSTGGTTTERVTLLVDQPPSFSSVTATVYRNDMLIWGPYSATQSLTLSEDQHLALSLVGNDPDPSTALTLSATGGVFQFPYLATAALGGESATTPLDLPIIAGPEQGILSVTFDLEPTYRTVSPTVQQSSGEIILTLSDGNLEQTVSLPITLVHQPTVPQIAISGLRLGGQSIPIDPNVQVNEGTPISIDLVGNDVSGEELTLTQTQGTGVGSFTSAPSIDHVVGSFDFQPNSFDADLPEGGPPTLYDSPIDPSDLEFTITNESGLQSSLAVHLDIVNEPAAPELTTSVILDGRSISPDSATVTVVPNQQVIIHAEAVDPDKDLVMIEFGAPPTATEQVIHREFGSATSELSLTFDDSFSIGDTVEISVRAWDQLKTSPSVTYTFQVVGLSEQLAFQLPFQGVLTSATGSVFISAATRVMIRETDCLDLIVRGEQASGDPLTVSAEGTALSNPRLQESRFAGQSLSLGDALPFVANGVGAVNTNYRLRPGLKAVPPTQATEEFSLNLELSDGVLQNEQTLKIIVENAPTVPTISLESIRVDDVPVVSMTDSVQVAEGSVLTVEVEADDLGSNEVFLKASGLPEGATFHTAASIPPVTGTLVYQPGPFAAESAPYSIILTATSEGGGVSWIVLNIAVIDRCHPPQFQFNLTIDQEPVPLSDPIDLDTLEGLTLNIAGADPDSGDSLILSVSGTALSAPELEAADFAGMSLKTGDTLPFQLEGNRPEGILNLYPGVWANLPGDPPTQYGVELRLSDGVFDVSRTLRLNVTAAEAPPIVTLSAVSIDGVSQTPGSPLQIAEGQVLSGTVTAIDPAGLPLVLSVEEPKGLAQVRSATGVGEVSSVFSVAPSPVDSSSTPLEITFTATNERSEFSDLHIPVELLDVDFPAQAAFKVFVDGQLYPSTEIYEATVGHPVTVVGYGWDPDQEAVILNTLGEPPSSDVNPLIGFDIALGAEPAVISVTFVPQVAGEIVSITFVAGDSLLDVPRGDVSVAAKVLVKSASIPPILTVEPASPDPIQIGESINLVVFTEDPEGDAVTLYPFFDGHPVTEGRDGFLLLSGFYESGTAGAILVFQPGQEELGDHILTIEATDGQATRRKTVPLRVIEPVGTPTPTPTPTPTAIPDLMLLSQGYGGKGTSKRLQFVDDTWRLLFFSAFQGLTRNTAAKLNTTRERSVNTAVADVNGDGVKDIVVGFGPGGWGSTQPSILVVWRTFGGSFGRSTRIISKGVFAPNSPNPKFRNLHGALNVAAGHFVDHGLPMIAAAQGIGGNHQIRILKYDTEQGILETIGTFRGLQREALWGNSSGGTAVAAGDVNGDGLDELVVGQVNGASATTLFQIVNLERDPTTNEVRIADWTEPVEAFPPHQQGLGGVRLAVGDVNGDSQNEIIVATAGKVEPGPKNFVRVFQVEVDPGGSITAITPITRPVQVFGEKQNPSGGIDIAAGNLDADVADELLIGAQAIIHLDRDTGAVTFDFAPPRNRVKGLNFEFDSNGVFVGTSLARTPFSPFAGLNTPTSQSINVEFYPAE